jgi:predicted peptidase
MFKKAAIAAFFCAGAMSFACSDNGAGNKEDTDSETDSVIEDGGADTDTDTDTESDTGSEDIGTDESGLFSWTDADDNKFGLYLPEDWSGANLPVVMFLHGYTGNPIGLTPWIVSALNDIEPCAVFLPFRPSSEGASAWGGTYDENLRPAMVTVLAELDRLIEKFEFDTKRQYLYGESMGGEGVYKLLVTYPERFADAVVAAGYTVIVGADLMAQTPLWIIHGSDDTIADVSQARNIYQAVLDEGGTQIIYTEYEGLEHVPTISAAASEPDLITWILKHKKGDGST